MSDVQQQSGDERKRTQYDAYLELRLQQWAGWYLSIARGEIGWPTINLIEIFRLYGSIPRSGKRPEMRDNEYAEEVEKWVKALGKQYPLLETALRTYYFDRLANNSKKLKPVKMMARKHETSITVFKERVMKAKIWIAGRVSRDYE